MPAPDARIVESVAVLAIDLFALGDRSAGIAGDLVAVELDEGAHDVLGVVEQDRIEQVLFEESVEVFAAEQVSDGGTDALGLLGVALAEFGVDCLANIAETVGRYEALKDVITLATVYSA